jgi:preprotein translocase subunit SecA
VIEGIIKSLFGDIDTKKLKNYQKIVEAIKEREVAFEKFSEEDIKNKTAELKTLFIGLDFTKKEDSLQIKKILEDIKVDAFTLVKQATKLLYGKKFTLPSGKEIVWNMIPYDVQLIGGLNIHYG